MSKIRLGAPSLTGKDANELVDEVFGDLAFPLKARFTNLVAHGLNFPEVNRLHMAACTDEQECSVVVDIASLESLHRLASSIEQVAELNRHIEMVDIDTDLDVKGEDYVEDNADDFVIEQEDEIGEIAAESVIAEVISEQEVAVEEPVRPVVHRKKGR